ncbi:AMP-binding protein [Actinacidiphila sp. bgisy145]|uniref:AMP-binding protein n=1 Tax=Actinacidiphila sp. bgisy145 TaxID=3413792 RepID=UPI003EC101A3
MTAHRAPATRRELALVLREAGGRLDDVGLAELQPRVDDYVRRLNSACAGERAVIALTQESAEDFFAVVLAAWLTDSVPLLCASLTDAPHGRLGAELSPTARVCRPAGSDAVVDGDSTAVLHMTSGSTGRPRIARRSCASVLNEAAGYRARLLLSPDDTVYVPIPLTHSYGWGVAFAALMAGARLDARRLVHARRAAARVEAASVVALTAPMADLLASTPTTPSAGPRIVMVGASRVSRDLDERFAVRFGVRLTRNYGCSETGPTFIGAAGLPENAVGTPMPGVAVLAPEPGAEGELRLLLDAPAEGFLGACDKPVTQWATGDLVRRGQDGVVTFLARLHSSARLNDRTVDLDGLCRAIRHVPGVVDVFPVVLARSASETEDLYAVVQGTGVNRSQVEQSRSAFPAGTGSVRLVYCDMLPTTVSGKVDRAHMIKIIDAEWPGR